MERIKCHIYIYIYISVSKTDVVQSLWGALADSSMATRMKEAEYYWVLTGVEVSLSVV